MRETPIQTTELFIIGIYKWLLLRPVTTIPPAGPTLVLILLGLSPAPTFLRVRVLSPAPYLHPVESHEGIENSVSPPEITYDNRLRIGKTVLSRGGQGWTTPEGAQR